MKPFLAAFSFILLSLAAGCLEKTQEPGILFVCPEGKIVSNSSDCGINISSSLPETSVTQVNEKRISADHSSCIDLGCGNETRFIGNKRTMKYHLCDCRYAANMSMGNRVCLKDEKEAASLNYSPCMMCDP